MDPAVAAVAGWTPARLSWGDGSPVVDWYDLRDRRFTAPFFDTTVSAALEHPYTVLMRNQTTIDLLPAVAAQCPTIAPTGFIFHQSRCGSTLLAQMLAALPQNIVISEASVIESLLRLHLYHPTITEDERITWFRGLIGALGQQRHAEERQLFVKFDPWQTLDLPLIRRAFPGVPWLFLYRDPVEILVSQRHERGGRMIPAPLETYLLGLDYYAASQMPPEEYHARVLAAWCETALRHDGPSGGFLNYRQLPDALPAAIARHFRVSYRDDEYTEMLRVTGYHSKRPHVVFEGDTLDKQRVATAREHQMADAFVRPLYDRLEVLREQVADQNDRPSTRGEIDAL